MTIRNRRRSRSTVALIASAATLLLLAGCSINVPADPTPEPTTPSVRPHPEASVDVEAANAVRDEVIDLMEEWDLRAVIVRATRDGEQIITEAFGESMTGVPATKEMHFRNGAVAISYVSTALLLLVEDGQVSLDDKLVKWLPEVPHAGQVTLGQLAQMTSGYPDYLWDPEVLDLLNEDPFRQWEPEELVAYATSKPLLYEPGTNWNYSHTSYVLLGLALEKITDKTVSELLEERVLGPLELTETADPGTPAIPDPVLHSFTSERRVDFGLADDVSFIEDSTFWNPSWTITRGAIQYTNIYDMTRTAEAIGNGELLSSRMHDKQLNTDTRKTATALEGCPACFPHNEVYTYGMGVVLMGDWVVQNPMFRGGAAVTAYLPDENIAIAVAATFEESAFDESGFVPNLATDLFRELAEVLSPGSSPPSRQ